MKFFVFVAAFAGGTLLAYLQYLLSRYVLLHNESRYPLVAAVRIITGIAYLAAMFFLGRRLGNIYFMLIGGAVGTTVPMAFFTVRLTKLTAREHREDENG